MRDLETEYMALRYYQQLYDIEEKHWWISGMRDAMDALLSPVLVNRGKLRALDIGCGTGYLMTYLENHYPIAGQVADWTSPKVLSASAANAVEES